MDAAYKRLDPAALTLYAELLGQLLAAQGEAAAAPAPGTLVSKQVKGSTYWYVQYAALGARRQVYLGPDSPDLRAQMAALEATWADLREDAEARGTLVSMLLAAGLPAPDGAALRVLEVLAQRGVFRAGGVLVGSHAFAAYGPMLGVQWSAAWQTADVDIASAPDIRIAVEADADLPAALVEANPRFLPVPGLDPRTPSTSFKVRGRSLRVDVVTPLVGEPGHGPVFLKALNVAAQPVRFLDYLIEAHQPAALVGRSGVLVNVPVPARFAVHELLVAQSRPVSDHAKVRKDLQEAEQLIAVLAEDRPGDLGRAWRAACDRGPGWKKRVEAGAARLSVDARRALGE